MRLRSLARILTCGRKGERNIPQWTSPRHIHQPWIDTLGMELVVAREDPQILPLDKVIRTDRARKVTGVGGGRGCTRSFLIF